MSGISSSTYPTYYSGFTASQTYTVNSMNLLGSQTSHLLGISSTPQLGSSTLAVQPGTSSNFADGQLTALQAFAGYLQTAYAAAQSLLTQYQSGAFNSSTMASAATGNPREMGGIANDLGSFSTQSLSGLNLQSSSLVSQALIAQQQMMTTNPDSQYVNPHLSSLLTPMSTTSLLM